MSEFLLIIHTSTRSLVKANVWRTEFTTADSVASRTERTQRHLWAAEATVSKRRLAVTSRWMRASIG